MNVIPQRVRDGFGKLIDPLALVFIRLHVRPNLITTVGTLVVIASAVAFGVGGVRSGGLLLLVSGVFDLLGGRVPRRPRGLAHRVVHAGAGRGAGSHGQGRDCATRRARAAAGRPDAVFRPWEPRGAVVLDRCRSGARHLGDGGAARALRRARVRRALRETAATPTRHAPGPRARATISERTVIVGPEAGRDIAPAKGKLGVMLVGLGAVSTTFIAGVENVRRGTGLPIGSLSQMGTIRLGKRTEKRSPKIKEFVPLADLKYLVFTAWDPIPDDAYTAAVKAGVLDRHEHLEPIADFLKG